MWIAQQLRLETLEAELAGRRVKCRRRLSAAPSLQLSDRSWELFVTNRGEVNACPREGKLLRFSSAATDKQIVDIVVI